MNKMVLILLLLLVIALFLIFRPKKQSSHNKNELNADWLPTYRKDVPNRKQSDYPSVRIATTYTNADDNDNDNDYYGEYNTNEPIYIIGEEKELWLELDIDYVDARGVATNRQIRLKRYSVNEDNTNAMLFAYCYLRNAHRTFYASRVKRCVDLENGEIIENLPKYLEKEYEDLYVEGIDNKLLVELKIEYRDRTGKSVGSQVKVKRFKIRDDKSEAILWGYCSVDNKNKEFYATRISKCIELETGKGIDDIFEYITNKYEQSTEVQLNRIWSKSNDELSFLIYVAKLDGVLKQNEKQVIASYALLKNPTTLATEEEIIAGMKGITLISKNQFARLLGKLSNKEEQEKKELIDYAERIINTKKKKSAEEEAIIPYIVKRLFPNSK